MSTDHSHNPHLSFARRRERNTDAKYMFRMATYAWLCVRNFTQILSPLYTPKQINFMEME